MMPTASRRVLVPLDLPPAAVPDGTVQSLHGATMGTSWSARLVADAARLPELHHVIQSALDDVVAQMSHWEAGSDLGRFNRALPGTWQVLPEAFFTVLDCAIAIARDSAGAYDPTIGTLVDLWGFGPRGAQAPVTAPPSGAAIRQARATCGWQRITLDHATRRVQQPGGLALDFSSIAKGFGVDHAAQALERAGVRSYLLEVGGELRGLGAKPDGTPWWVELERPPHDACTTSSTAPDTQDGPVDVVALHGLSVATSGDYRRYFEHDGVRYAHTLDPRTGYPVQHTASVTVLHASCMVADALATLLTVLGPDAAPAYAERCGLAARMLYLTPTGMRESCSSAFTDMLT
ncbi:FAD:protein FMN transferase [Imbroritus primus]